MKKSIFKRWYFWGIVAVVIIGLANASDPAVEKVAPPADPVVAPVKEPVKETKKAPKEDPGISKEEFEAIENGMTYEEVVKIIGGEGEVLSEVGTKGEQFYTIMYMYNGEKGLGSNANFTFQDGELQAKAQFGL